MVSLVSLWLPVVLSAVAVFVLSAIFWMVMPWHRKDFRMLPDESAVRTALRGAAPGQYSVPNMVDRSELQSPEFRKKFEEGPVGYVMVVPNGQPSMSRNLVQWFVWTLFVSLTVGYIVSRSIPGGVGFTLPFQVGSTVAWAAYSWAYATEVIWFGRPWSYVGKQLFDGLLYGLATGALFGWLYP